VALRVRVLRPLDESLREMGVAGFEEHLEMKSYSEPVA